jgi:hypothetical protein
MTTRLPVEAILIKVALRRLKSISEINWNLCNRSKINRVVFSVAMSPGTSVSLKLFLSFFINN